MKTGILMRIAIVTVAMIFATSLASAQANSAPQTITLNANLPESLSITLSATSVNFTLVAGSNTNAGSSNITATTSWVLKPGRTAVNLYAFFGNAAAALTDGTDNIPSSAFSISDNGGAAAALTNTVAFGGANAGLQLSTVAITGANKNSSHNDTMAFNINLSGLSQLPANAYTGTLNVQAQATP